MDDSERPERPGPDADPAEIARWMEEDFWWTVAEGVADAVDENDPDDEHEVVEAEILDHQRGEVVGTIVRTGTSTRRARRSGTSRRSISRGVSP